MANEAQNRRPPVVRQGLYSFRHQPLPERFIRAFGADPTKTECYVMNTHTVVVIEQHPAGWHLSLYNEKRLPNVSELIAARQAFVPDHVGMAIDVPSKTDTPPKKNGVSMWQTWQKFGELPDDAETA